jgi:adenosine deaminase
VVALSIDGNEAATGRTGQRFAAAFDLAARGGLHRTVHAGESSGPEGVRDAINLLLAERIDHGIRSIEEPALVRELVDRGIPLNVCPTSNVQLGLVRDLTTHPLEPLRAAGVQVSINTDDPSYLGTTLEGEFATCVDAFRWNPDVVRSVAKTSIEASFCDDDTRRDLLQALDSWTARRLDA